MASPERTPAWAVVEPAADDPWWVEHGPLLAYLLTPAAAFLVASPFF